MARLCKAGIQLREQLDDLFPHRQRKSDGWIADARHLANEKSDHIPDKYGIVRAIDIDKDLAEHPETAHAIVEKLRLLAKRGDKRIKYIIFDGFIMSPIRNWKRRRYTGANPHRSHFHVSFTRLGDRDGSWFEIGDENDLRSKTDGGHVAQNLRRDGSIDLPFGGAQLRLHPQCGTCECFAFRD